MPKRVDHHQRRIEIISAAARVGGLEGLSNLSLGNVAAAAGISKGRIQHYFDSKEALLIFAAEYRDRVTTDLVQERIAALVDPTPLEKLRAAMVGLVPWSPEHRYIALLGTAPFLLEIRSPAAQQAIRKRHDAYLEFMETLVREAQQTGEIDSAILPATLARLTTAIVVGLVSRALSDYESETELVEDIDAWIAAIRVHTPESSSTPPPVFGSDAVPDMETGRMGSRKGHGET